jgi:hypothetical protein
VFIFHQKYEVLSKERRLVTRLETLATAALATATATATTATAPAITNSNAGNGLE